MCTSSSWDFCSPVPFFPALDLTLLVFFGFRPRVFTMVAGSETWPSPPTFSSFDNPGRVKSLAWSSSESLRFLRRRFRGVGFTGAATRFLPAANDLALLSLAGDVGSSSVVTEKWSSLDSVILVYHDRKRLLFFVQSSGSSSGFRDGPGSEPLLGRHLMWRPVCRSFCRSFYRVFYRSYRKQLT